jgi:hypothetical protein
MVAYLSKLALLEDDNLVSIADSRQSMGDHYSCHSTKLFADSID